MSASVPVRFDLRGGQVHRDALYIGGAWIQSSGAGVLTVTDAGTGAVMGTVPEGTAEDADLAVAAARRAFAGWSATPPQRRADIIDRLADLIEERSELFTSVMAREVGMPYQVAVGNQTNLPVTDLRTYASVLRDFEFTTPIGTTSVEREPVGVVAAITPWNYPLHQVAAKVGAALAAGCPVVLKPSEVAPLSAFLFADLCEQAGLPAGAFNVVSGTGPVVGEALATHRGVDMVSFTGSTRAGRRVMALAAESVKKVALELGGKSANILLSDADFEVAVPRGVDDCLRNAGQNCTALTRMIVPHDKLAQVERLAAERAASYVAGDLFDPATTLGALASATQLDRVRGYIVTGLAEGARLVTGGPHPVDGGSTGFFVRPTIFSNVDNSSAIAQEEIFGPVLCIIPYGSEQEAVALANDSPYGLSGAVWSADPEHAVAVARQLRTGRVSINGAPYNPFAPFGGYKQSGLGRELGRYGIEEFLEVKAIMR